jgi:methylmalonyl-CoA mutase C-terminal domain/subunit
VLNPAALPVRFLRREPPVAASSDRPIRVLVAKPGLDGHDRGAKVVAATLRDAGMEVIYSGLHQTPEMIVEAAVQEDVDVVGLSILSGAHMTHFPRIRQLLVERGMGHVLLTGGGIIPKEDAEALEKKGFAKLFGPGTTTGEIVEFLRAEVGRRRRGRIPAAAAAAGAPKPSAPRARRGGKSASAPRRRGSKTRRR